MNDLVLKDLFARSRPFMEIDRLDVLVAFPMSHSFPSGHASSSFAAAYVLAKEFGRKGAWGYLPASLIAISRIYVGVHYLTDILGGAILGTGSAIVLYHLAAKYIHLQDRRIQVRRKEPKSKKTAE